MLDVSRTSCLSCNQDHVLILEQEKDSALQKAKEAEKIVENLSRTQSPIAPSRGAAEVPFSRKEPDEMASQSDSEADGVPNAADLLLWDDSSFGMDPETSARAIREAASIKEELERAKSIEIEHQRAQEEVGRP